MLLSLLWFWFTLYCYFPSHLFQTCSCEALHVPCWSLAWLPVKATFFLSQSSLVWIGMAGSLLPCFGLVLRAVSCCWAVSCPFLQPASDGALCSQDVHVQGHSVALTAWAVSLPPFLDWLCGISSLLLPSDGTDSLSVTHRITEWWELDGTSRDNLVHPSC